MEKFLLNNTIVHKRWITPGDSLHAKPKIRKCRRYVALSTEYYCAKLATQSNCERNLITSDCNVLLLKVLIAKACQYYLCARLCTNYGTKRTEIVYGIQFTDTDTKVVYQLLKCKTTTPYRK